MFYVAKHGNTAKVNYFMGMHLRQEAAYSYCQSSHECICSFHGGTVYKTQLHLTSQLRKYKISFFNTKADS